MSKIVKKLRKTSARRCPKPDAIPEVVAITPDDFKFRRTRKGNIIAVTLQTTNGEPIQYTMDFEKWAAGLSAQCRFLNQHLAPLPGW